MPLNQREKAYVTDMLDAAREIDKFIAGVSLQAYENDRKLQLAVERLLEIMGEAARRVSHDCRSEYGDVPWVRIVGLRNVLTHEYGEIRNDIVWRVAAQRIPEILDAIEEILRDH